nr:hypothetical protein [Tanacetum cinerariifolium]
MIANPGEPDLPVQVPESFHEQTGEELTKNDVKRMDSDDQSIQTILLGLPEDVYAAMDSCETAKEIWERVRQKMKDQSSSNTYPKKSFPINNKYNPQPSLNQNFMQPPMSSLEDINDPTENVRRNGGNQFGQYARQVAQNQQGYNAWQNGGIQGAQNAGQNMGVQSGGNQNGLVVVLRIANQNKTGNVVAARAEGAGNRNQARCYNCRGLGIQLQAEEFDFMAAAGDLDEIEEANANCILMANL